MPIFVHHDRSYFGRGHGVDDELCVVVVEWNDVDPLAGDLIGNRLYARTAHSDARADRVDARIVAANGDFGAHPRVAGSRKYVDEPLTHFRHFELEQLDQ